MRRSGTAWTRTVALVATLFGAAASAPQARAQAEPSSGAASVAETSPEIRSVIERSRLSLLLAGYAHHFREERCRSCRRDFVPGIGLAWDAARHSALPLTLSVVGGVQNDSYGATGGYAGAVAAYGWSGAGLEWKAGLGAFAFYRAKNSHRDMETVVTALPTLSIEHAPSGWGLDMILAPNFRRDGKDRSGFVTFLLRYRFAAGS